MEVPDTPEVTLPHQVDLSVASSSNGKPETWPEYCNPSYVMPDVIEVRVLTEIGQDIEEYTFPVQIIKAAKDKPYLGGFRNKGNGQIYLHANSQTPIDVKKPKKVNNNASSRQTQTYETRTLSIQPYRESGTQMDRPDLKLDNSEDREVISKPYFTSESLLHLKKEKIIEIQRYWRGYMARIRADQIRQRNAEYNNAIVKAKEDEMEELKKTTKETLSRRTNPKTNSDFALLYNELDTWRKEEITKIKKSANGEKEIRAAMSDLLVNETKALQSMQRLKLEAHKAAHKEKTMQMLAEMAKPHEWQLSRGEIATIQTPQTIQAKELLDLYQQLQLPVTQVDSRLEILLNVKWAMGEFDTGLTRDIKDLVDREADLLSRGRPINSMTSLRLRLDSLVLEFVQNGHYNPRANDFLLGV